VAETVRDTTHDSEILQSRELALTIADLIADTPAADTRVMDIHELTTIADFFVICSGENERQLRAISRTLTDELGERDIHPLHIEGEPVSGWILLDFNHVMVHVFDEQVRSFYNLEDRWAEAPVVVSIQ
jgi:ribosome-associated protein